MKSRDFWAFLYWEEAALEEYEGEETTLMVKSILLFLVN